MPRRKNGVKDSADPIVFVGPEFCESSALREFKASLGLALEHISIYLLSDRHTAKSCYLMHV